MGKEEEEEASVLDPEEEEEEEEDPEDVPYDGTQVVERVKRVGQLEQAQEMSFYVSSTFSSDGEEAVLDDDELNDIRRRARAYVRRLYPQFDVVPNIQDTVRTILLHNGGGMWRTGDWVEYLGRDMQWHLAQVRGVVRQAPDSWDWNDPANYGKEPHYSTFYNVGNVTLLSESMVRASKAGLQQIFGRRPWVWQQYAFLRIEKHARFQKDHERDFFELDCQYYADKLFGEWLEDPRNQDFRDHFMEQPESAREMLRNHLVAPFEILDQITEEPDEWEFADKDISLYTYVSILGSGSFFAFTCAVIQLLIPMVLLERAIATSDRFEAKLTWDEFYIRTTPELVCTGSGSLEGKLMIMAVVSVYMLTVIPDSLDKFFRATGEATSTYSRLNSLRQAVWNQADDTFAQQVGFKLDRYMNTAYVCTLYAVMLFILFNTTEVLDIILNALAGEFIHQLDEQIAAADWFDDNNRWLAGGAWQLALQSAVRLRIIEDPTEFCRAYNISLSDYRKALGGLKPLRAPAVARRDDEDIRFMDAEDAMYHECARYAAAKKNRDGVLQFRKAVTNFSLMDRLLNKVRINKFGIFDQYRAYRTWSRWDKVLWLSPVPATIVDIDTEVPDRKARGYRALRSPLLNFSRDVVAVLSGARLATDIGRAVAERRTRRVPFHVLDGILQWISYVAQIVFPLAVLAGLFLVPLCY